MPISTFADGFGRRFRLEADGDRAAETLQLCDDLAEIEGVEVVLADRIAELLPLGLKGLTPTRAVARGQVGVILTSDLVPGVRLADILRAAERRWLDPDLPSALAILLQVTASVAALHESGRHLAHGTLGPERIVVRDDGAVDVVEGVLVAALARFEATRLTLWRQFRVAVPAVAGAPSLGQAADILQLGLLALALARGRLLGRDDFPARIPMLLQEAAVADPLGHRGALPKSLLSWIARALQLDARAEFRSARDAEAGLVRAMADAALEKTSNQAVGEWVSAALTGEVPDRPGAATLVAPEPPAARRSSAASSIAPAHEVPRRPPSGRSRSKPARGRQLRIPAAAAGVLLLCAGVYLAGHGVLGPVLFPTGRLSVESRPGGLEVLIDGRLKGSTPLELELRAGRHTLALRSSLSTTLVPVSIEAGARHHERIEVRRGRTPLRTSTVRRADQPPSEPGK